MVICSSSLDVVAFYALVIAVTKMLDVLGFTVVYIITSRSSINIKSSTTTFLLSVTSASFDSFLSS
jgi:hypothetical protein